MISAIVLAAGEARRFGDAKQLAVVNGKPLLQHALDAVRDSRVDDIVVILGAYANEIRERIEFRDERIVVNPDFARGMSTSIQAGLRAVDSEAAFIVLADQPFVSARTYDRLIDEYRRTRAKVIVPTFDGTRGNPVLIDKSLFGEAMQLRGDTGFRAIFANHEVVNIPVDDRGVLVDIDTPADVPVARAGHETFDLIERLRRSGRRAVMATLVRTKGTTPRKEGTKMFVGDEGDIFGSVTIGGCVDARVIEHSNAVLESSSPQLLDFQLGDEEAWEIGLTCGGAVDVFVEPLTKDIIDLYDKAKDEWEAGRTSAIATVVSGPETGKRFLVADPPKSSGTMTLDGRDVYIEVLRPPSTLVVFGASAVAIPLVTFAKELGFRTIVIDGRAKFATRERFPDADDIRIGMVSEIASQMALGPSTPVVLVAHDYKIDVPVLKRTLATNVPYIGLLGSRRRGAAILQMLRDEGVAEDQLSRIHNPIGLDLGGESAAEIALAIVSEIVAVTHGRSGAPLRNKQHETVLTPSR